MLYGHIHKKRIQSKDSLENLFFKHLPTPYHLSQMKIILRALPYARRFENWKLVLYAIVFFHAYNLYQHPLGDSMHFFLCVNYLFIVLAYLFTL